MLAWMPTIAVDAAACHFFVSMWAMAQCRAWGWRWWTGPLFVVVFALVKEFWVDIRLERDSWTGSAIDASWYGIGMVVGYFLQRWTLGRQHYYPMD